MLDPHALIRQVGVDVFRYFLLKEGRLHDDAGQQSRGMAVSAHRYALDFSEARLLGAEAELANVLGEFALCPRSEY